MLLPRQVSPDILTLAKAIAAGLPLGATMAKEEIMERLLENTTRQGAYLIKRLKEMQQRYPIMGDVRGKGLMIGAEFVKDPETKEPAVQELQGVMNKCFERGLAIITSGKSSMRFAPPLIITREIIGAGLEIFEGAVKEVAAQIK